MVLSKDDLSKISNLVKAGNEYLESMIESRFSRFEGRFSMIERKLEGHDGRFDMLDEKINRLIKAGNEGIFAIMDDVDKIKIRLKKAGV